MKISIITVTYNNVSVINDCLDSVKLQNYNNIEHIIIDGGSTDGTLQYLQSKRAEFKTLISEPDNGIYDAMNKGIKYSTGDIVGFLNSDDFYANNEVISKVVSEFEKESNLQACYSDSIYINKKFTSKIVRYFKSCEFRHGLFSKGWCPPHPTFFVKKSIYESYGYFDLNYNIASDIDLMMRFLEIHKIRSKYVPEVWVKMRMGGTTNKSLKNILKQNFEILNSLKKNKLEFSPLVFFIHKMISRSRQFIQK